MLFCLTDDIFATFVLYGSISCIPITFAAPQLIFSSLACVYTLRYKVFIVLNCSCFLRATSFFTVSMHSLKIFKVASISAYRVCTRELTMLPKSRFMSINRCSSFSMLSCYWSYLLSIAWAICTRAYEMHSCSGTGFEKFDVAFQCSITG